MMETSDTASPQHGHGEQAPNKFTPGPWLLCAHLREGDQCSCGYRGGIWGADQERIICEMGSQPTPGQEGMEPPRYPREVEFANARLIAAAPDMLEAMKAARDQTLMVQHSQETRLNDIYDILEAAIAKATGVTAP